MSFPVKSWRVRVEMGVYVANVVVQARHHEEAEKMAEIEMATLKRRTNRKLTITGMTTTELVLPE